VLQVSNATAAGYLDCDSETFPRNFSGVASPMLTVWRRLHLEIDSMNAVPETKPEPDHMNVTRLAWTALSKGGRWEKTLRKALSIQAA